MACLEVCNLFTFQETGDHPWNAVSLGDPNIDQFYLPLTRLPSWPLLHTRTPGHIPMVLSEDSYRRGIAEDREGTSDRRNCPFRLVRRYRTPVDLVAWRWCRAIAFHVRVPR